MWWTDLCILSIDPVLECQFDQRGDIVRRLRPLVPQRVKADKSQLVERRNRGIRDQVLDRLQIRTLPATCKTLFNLASRQEPIPLDQSTKLSDNRNVFADVTAEFSKLRVLFDEPFHVLDRLDVRWSVSLGFRLVHLDVCLEVRSEVPKRGEMMSLEERVCAGRQRDLLRES